MTAPFRSPQTPLNLARIRQEQRAARYRLTDIAIAAFLCLAALQGARMVLKTALELPETIATTAERNAP